MGSEMCIRDRGNVIHGDPPRPACEIPITKPVRVQTVDPLLFIVPRWVLQRIEFDEKTCSGWHLYAEDYCLSVYSELGLYTYVIPLKVYHRSTGVKPERRNLWNPISFLPYPNEFYETLCKLIKQPGKNFKKICTTCGVYPSSRFPRIMLYRLAFRTVSSRLANKILLLIFDCINQLLDRASLYWKFFASQLIKAEYKCKGLRDYIELAFSFSIAPKILVKVLDLISSPELKDKIHNLISIKPAQIKAEISKFILFVLNNIGKPKAILEIGTARGGTLYLLTRIAHKNAIIISIDLPGGSFGGGYPYGKGYVFKLFARGNQRLFLIRGDPHNRKTLYLVQKILKDRSLDLLFIDGDHTYEGVKKDFELYVPLAANNGIIAFHDIVPGAPECVGGVPLFWNEIKNHYDYLEIISSKIQQGFGIGILMKSRKTWC